MELVFVVLLSAVVVALFVALAVATIALWPFWLFVAAVALVIIIGPAAIWIVFGAVILIAIYGHIKDNSK